jgi:hypothetical protein
MQPQKLQAPADLLIDPLPDERGNVMVAAAFLDGHMIALGFNAN